MLSKISLRTRIPSEYNRQSWFDMVNQIETLVNKFVDGYLFQVTSISADYTAHEADSIILADATSAAITVTLPPAAESVGKRITVKKIDASANAVTVDGNGSETIDDATTAVISSQYDSICLVSDNTEWWIV